MTNQERIDAILAAHRAGFHNSWDEETKTRPPWEVNDETFPLAVPLLIGRTIASITREPSSGQDFEQCANWVVITLDDGSELHFNSYGFDADGVITLYAPPKGDR